MEGEGHSHVVKEGVDDVGGLRDVQDAVLREETVPGIFRFRIGCTQERTIRGGRGQI